MGTTTSTKRTEKKSDYGFSSVSVKHRTVERLRKLRDKLTDQDLGSPTMDEVISRCCTALETELKGKAVRAAEDLLSRIPQ